MTFEIYLLRHTPVEISKDICYGQMDVDVATSFSRDFEQIAAYLDSKLPFNYVFSSPKIRCTKLAHRLTDYWLKRGSRLEVQVHSGLCELNFGHWEGKKWNEIDPAQLNTWSEDFVHRAPPGGESLLELSERARRGFWEICQKVQSDCLKVGFAEDSLKKTQYPDKTQGHHGRVLMITHGGFIRALLALLLKMPLDAVFKLKIDYGYLVGLDYQEDEAQLKLITPLLDK